MVVAVAIPYLQNTITLKFSGWHEEALANNGNIIPGHLVQLQSDGGLLPHPTYGGRAERAFAKEDALQGNWFNTAFASGSIVPYAMTREGDHILAVIPANCPAYSEGQPMMSNGDGTLVPVIAGTGNVLKAGPTGTDTLSALAAETAFASKLTIAANSLQVGDIIKVRIDCIATAVNSTNTFIRKLKIGTNANLTSSSPTTIATQATVNPTANDIAFFDVELVVTAIGATGKMTATGYYGQGTPGSVTNLPVYLASFTVDTTVTEYLGVTCTQSANNAGNVDQLVVDNITLFRSALPAAVVAYALTTVDNSAGATPIYAPVRTT